MDNTLETTSFAANSARCPRKVSMASTADDTESTGTFFCPADLTAFSKPSAHPITKRAGHDVEKALVPSEPEAVVETAASKLRISRSDQLSYSGQGEAALLQDPANDVKLTSRQRGWQWRPIDKNTAFAPPFGTIRQCRVCGCLVAGGPTACARCAKAGA